MDQITDAMAGSDLATVKNTVKFICKHFMDYPVVAKETILHAGIRIVHADAILSIIEKENVSFHLWMKLLQKRRKAINYTHKMAEIEYVFLQGRFISFLSIFSDDKSFSNKECLFINSSTVFIGIILIFF